jgi:hypothetical protein
MAAPRTPTPEFTAAFARLTRRFYPFRVACWTLGVREQTAKGWLKRGTANAPADERYAAFHRAYTEAHDAALAEVIGRLVELTDSENRVIGGDAAAFLRKWAREHPDHCPGLPDRFRPAAAGGRR